MPQVIAFVKEAANDDVRTMNLEHQIRYRIAGGKKWKNYPLPYPPKLPVTDPRSVGLTVYKKPK